MVPHTHALTAVAVISAAATIILAVSPALALDSNKANSVQHITATGVTKGLPIFSHATVYNGVVYVSCLPGFLPGTRKLASPDPGEQARQVLRNMQVILKQSGSSLDRTLKITVFMTDMNDFDKINAAINEAFPTKPPARSSISVKELPSNAKVIIEAIAATK